MGLETGNKMTYLTVGDGKIIQSYGVDQDTPDAQERTKKDGSIVYELRYKALTGYLTDILVIENNFNGKVIKNWNFIVQDGDETFNLQMGYRSKYAKTALYALPNAEMEHPITFSPWMKIINDVKKLSMYLNQFGNGIEWYFNPYDAEKGNGIPPAVEAEFRGEKVWDDSKQMKFLEEYVKEHIKPKLGVKKPTFTEQLPEGPEDLEQGNSTEDEDDLPF